MDKEVCKRCINSDANKMGIALIDGWEKVDELHWDMGDVYCCLGKPVRLEWCWRSKEEAFSLCPRRFEHAVAEGMKHVK